METNINPPTIRNLIIKNVRIVKYDTPLAQVVKILLNCKASGRAVIMVVDANAEPLGFVSERDCLKHLSNQMFHAAPNLRAKCLVTKQPHAVSPETDLFTAASLMVAHQENYLPVMEDSRFIGIISLLSVLRGLNDYKNQTTEALVKNRYPPDIHKIANHRFIVRAS